MSYHKSDPQWTVGTCTTRTCEHTAPYSRLQKSKWPMRASRPPIKITKNATRYLTTTSMATPQQQKPLFQEGRLVLAINAYKQGQFRSFRAATSTVAWGVGRMMSAWAADYVTRAKLTDSRHRTPKSQTPIGITNSSLALSSPPLSSSHPSYTPFRMDSL